MREIRVLLADDHQIFLEGLKGLLESEFEPAMSLRVPRRVNSSPPSMM